MFLILLGPPGAGKGTQGAILAERLGCPKVSTGDLIRAAMRDGTPLGVKAREYYDQGLLVPDAVVLGLIEEVLEQPDATNGIVMDGFPRTPGQAEAVDRLLAARGVAVDRALSFEVPEEELVRRLVGRAAEQGRIDDSPEAVKKRLAVYREQTQPLEEFYGKRSLLTTVPATGAIDEIAERVRKVVGR